MFAVAEFGGNGYDRDVTLSCSGTLCTCSRSAFIDVEMKLCAQTYVMEDVLRSHEGGVFLRQRVIGECV